MLGLRAFLTTSFFNGIDIYWTLFRITLPLLLAVRLLDEYFNIIAVTGDLLAPLMNIVGLPGNTAIVFATGLFLQIYAAILVLATLWQSLELTTAQATILMTMMLVAHALPVELRIVQKAGMPLHYALLLRLTGAFVLGALLNTIYGSTYLQQPATLSIAITMPATAGWGEWMTAQAVNWAVIFIIVQILVLFVNLLRITHAERLLIWLLSPLFRQVGIGEKTTTMAMIGMLLGISYGGGMLIAEARRGNIARRDVLCTLSLLCLCHAIVEDTLLAMLAGAHISGVLFARLLFSFSVMALFHAFLRRYSPLAGTY